MNRKYTPGPWFVNSTGMHWNNPDLENLEICYGEDDECICDTVYKKSDARLIAAAPEMLEAMQSVRACKECGEDYGRCSKCDALLDKIIAKALGE